MKRSRYSEEQVVGILREAAGGMTTKAVCAKHNISEQTLYNWKRKYQGMEVGMNSLDWMSFGSVDKAPVNFGKTCFNRLNLRDPLGRALAYGCAA